jgi:hypothetical protein
MLRGRRVLTRVTVLKKKSLTLTEADAVSQLRLPVCITCAWREAGPRVSRARGCGKTYWLGVGVAAVS